MKLVKRRGTTKSRLELSEEQFKEVQRSFLAEIVHIAQANYIPPQLIINWDQTGLNIVPTYSWTMEEQGSKRVEIVGLGNKRQITATFAVAMSGAVLPVQILYAGKTSRCHPSYAFPESFDIWHTPNHWANADTTLRFISNIVVSYVAQVRAEMELAVNHPAIVIFDAFRGHSGEEVQRLLSDSHLLPIKVPSNCTDRLQPLDLSVNKAVKNKLRQCFSAWYASQVKHQIESEISVQDVRVDTRLSIMKEIEAKWIVSTYDYLCSNPSIIVNGFKAAGIVDAVEGKMDVCIPEVPSDDDPFAELTDED